MASKKDWKTWYTPIKQELDTNKDTASRLADSRKQRIWNQWLTLRHAQSAASTIHKVFKFLKPTPSNTAKITTVWSTDPANRAHPDCIEHACLIKDGTCTRCAAPAYVTNARKEVQQQVRESFRVKFTEAPPLPKALFKYKNNKAGHRIPHLRARPDWSQIKPEDRVYWTMYIAAPEATRHHYQHIMQEPSPTEFADYLHSLNTSTAP